MGIGAFAILVGPAAGTGAGAGAATSGCRARHDVVCLGRADGGHRVQVARGATVTVDLEGSGLRWSDLREVGPQLLRRTRSVVARSGGLAASYRAASSGRTELEARGAPRCAPRRACPQFLLLWEVQVVVG